MSVKNHFANISYLVIEGNSACNLKCQFCNREELVAQGMRIKKNATTEEFRKMLDVFRDCPIDTIKLIGLSEPMMHPKFDQLAALARMYWPKATIIMATNLQYNVHKSALMRTLPHVDIVYLSIDGVGEQFAFHREGGTYEKFVSSLEAIDAEIEEKHRAKLHFNFTATEFNYMCLPKVYELRDRFRLASVRINLAQQWSEDQGNQHDFHPEMKRMIKTYIADLKGVGGWQYRDCFWPYSGVVVDVYGNVRQCVMNTSQQPVGNILNEDFVRVFNEGAHYTQVRNALEKNTAAPSCRTCDYNNLSPILKEIFDGSGNAPRSH